MESPEPVELAEPDEPPEPAAPSEPADPPLYAAEKHFRTRRDSNRFMHSPMLQFLCIYLDEDDWAVPVEPLVTEAK